MAKKKLSQCTEQLEQHRRQSILKKHEEEKKEVQGAHLEELNEFNRYWDEKM